MARGKEHDAPVSAPSLAARPPVTARPSEEPTNGLVPGFVAPALSPDGQAHLRDVRSKQIVAQREHYNEMIANSPSKEDTARIVHLAVLEMANSEMSPSERAHPDDVRLKNEGVHEANMEFLRKDSMEKEVARGVEHDERLRRNNEVTNDNVDFIAREMKIGAAARFLSGH